MKESRTENSIKNIKTGMMVQLINKIMAFIVRTIFIKCLNTEYLGINGLFSNILSLLSFAELGIGTAIIYNMYKPIAEGNTRKIKGLMNLYKKSYNIIGIVVFMFGLLIIPFMNIIIKNPPDIKENLILIYILFLVDTVSSYFFTYKKSIIIAHEKQSIINNFDSIFYFVKSLLQILILYYTKNYILFLLTQIIGTLLENVLISFKANRMYPYLLENKSDNISNSEKKAIFSNIKALAVYQFGSVIMNGTDNILISSLINVSTVGLVSNYTLIITCIKSILNTGLNGITASVGNLNVSESLEKKEAVFYQLTYLYYLIYSFCSIAFVVLINPFIKLWLGKEYILSLTISIALSLSFFIEGLRLPCFIYRTTLGLFDKSKLTPYIGAISNIILSIVLCKFFGLVGIFIATSVAQLISYTWIDPYLIYKYEFNKPVFIYLKKYVIYFFTYSLLLILTLFVSNLIGEGVINFIIKIIVVILIPNMLNLIIFSRTKESNQLILRFKGLMKKKIHFRKIEND